jgi:beta-mannanase
MTPRRLIAVVPMVLGLVLGSAAPVLADDATPHSSSRARVDVEFGAFVGGMQAKPNRLARFERKMRAQTAVASYYYGFGDVFPGPIEHRFAAGGTRKVLVSWDMGPTRFTEWSSGRHDAYLDQIVAHAVTYPHDLYVRPWPEMNGDWQTFQPTPRGELPHGGTYAEFVAAWRHVVDYTRARGATNLKWVFNPTTDTYAETTPVAKIWPGDAYVDVLGLDGFNWGRDNTWGKWLSFKRIYTRQYRNLTALSPTDPVWVCEFGTKEPRKADGAPVDRRHSKAAWLRDALKHKGMPRIEVMIHFNEKKERDWRIESSKDSVRMLRKLL